MSATELKTDMQHGIRIETTIASAGVKAINYRAPYNPVPDLVAVKCLAAKETGLDMKIYLYYIGRR